VLGEKGALARLGALNITCRHGELLLELKKTPPGPGNPAREVYPLTRRALGTFGWPYHMSRWRASNAQTIVQPWSASPAGVGKLVV
jgi:hypothetical protein